MRVSSLALAAAERTVVHGADLSVASGQFVSLVGESGSGKTLTALACMGLLPSGIRISGGSIKLGGLELLGLEEKQWCRLRGSRLAMIFQEPMASLNPVMRVGAQIAEAVRRHSRCPPGSAREQAVEALRAVQIPDPALRARSYPHQLSGGMRQRAMIAMALACGPEVLIADEPTTALDVTVQAGIIELLQRLREERNLSILLITHDIALAAQASDRIVVMKQGRTVEEGPPAQLIGSPRHPYTAELIGHCRRREEWRAAQPG